MHVYHESFCCRYGNATFGWPTMAVLLQKEQLFGQTTPPSNIFGGEVDGCYEEISAGQEPFFQACAEIYRQGRKV